jgi:ligand-binding SRPBCC domain-containing protein
VRAYVLEREQLVAAGLGETFAYFSDARNLEGITPSWLRFGVVRRGDIRMGSGTLIEYRLRLHGVPVRWLTRIEVWEPGRRFVDVQVRGPYALWHHTHEFEAREGATLIRDRVRYRLPLGILGAAAHLAFVRRDLGRIFDHRGREVARRLGAGRAGAGRC